MWPSGTTGFSFSFFAYLVRAADYGYNICRNAKFICSSEDLVGELECGYAPVFLNPDPAQSTYATFSYKQYIKDPCYLLL